MVRRRPQLVARTTSRHGASRPTRSRIRCRRRRFTRLRVTAPPTELPTAKPTRAADWSTRGTWCTTRVEEPRRSPRRPRAGSHPSVEGDGLPAARKGVDAQAASGYGPCGGGRTGSTDRRGCASAGGTRASWHAYGCSVGTYAYSRDNLPGLEIHGAKRLDVTPPDTHYFSTQRQVDKSLNYWW